MSSISRPLLVAIALILFVNSEGTLGDDNQPRATVVRELIQSTRLETLPRHSLRTLHHLKAWEDELGIPNSITQTALFRFRILTPPNFRAYIYLILASIASILISMSFSQWTSTRQNAWRLRSVAALILLFTGLIHAFASYGTYGIITDPDGKNVPIRFEKTGEIDTTIPSGLLVLISESDGEYYKVKAPVSAYILKSQIHPLKTF